MRAKDFPLRSVALMSFALASWNYRWSISCIIVEIWREEIASMSVTWLWSKGVNVRKWWLLVLLYEF